MDAIFFTMGRPCAGCSGRCFAPYIMIADDGQNGLVFDGLDTHEFVVADHEDRVLSLHDFKGRLNALIAKVKRTQVRLDAAEVAQQGHVARARITGAREPKEPKELIKLRRRLESELEGYDAMLEHYHDRLRDFAPIVVAEQTLQRNDKTISDLSGDRCRLEEKIVAMDLLGKEEDRDFVAWVYQRFGGTLPDDFSVVMLNEQREAYPARDMLTRELTSGTDVVNRDRDLVGATAGS